MIYVETFSKLPSILDMHTWLQKPSRKIKKCRLLPESAEQHSGVVWRITLLLVDFVSNQLLVLLRLRFRIQYKYQIHHTIHNKLNIYYIYYTGLSI